MNNPNFLLQRMFAFARQAGEIALAHINDSQPGFKTDMSVITKADKAISALAREMLKSDLQTGEHILIDEEDPAIAETFNQEKLQKAKYVWAVDPIDGTRLYANGMPLFGISLGVLKDLKPWLGVVYFPMLNELFYCDGTDAFFVKDAFTSYEVRTKILLNTEELSARSLFFCNDTFFDKFYWKDKDFHIMIHACAVVNLCWPTIGRGVGCFLRCHVWDFAGSWPIIKKAGFDLRRVSDGKVMEQIDVDLFTNRDKPWHMKEYYLISTAPNFQAIKSKIAQR